MSKWHELETDQVLDELNTSKNGLSEIDAKRRLDAAGYNELKERRKATPLKLFLNQFKNFLILILAAAAIVSYLIGNLIDAVLIFLIIIVNAIFGFVQEYKAEKTLESLKKLSSQKAKAMRNGEKKIIESRQLVPGDVIILDEGDKIPADARLIEVWSIKVDESSLTGESVPVSKISTALKDTPLPERKNMVYRGTIVTYGRAAAVIVDTGMKTEIGKIADMVQSSEQETPLQTRINSFGKWIGLVVIAIAIIAAGIGIIKSYEIADMFLTSAALAVSAVPEGLPALLTITLALGVRSMSKKKAIVRKMSAVEALGSTTVILADKTGTMTTNEMTVNAVYLANDEVGVNGAGFEPRGEFSIRGKRIEPLKNKDITTALTISALCNNASLRKNHKWEIVGDPTEGALVVFAQKAGLDLNKLTEKYPRINEIPFSSERKMMSTVHGTGREKILYSKGAPEVILGKCTKILKNSIEAKLTNAQIDAIHLNTKSLADRGMRVLALAYGDGELERNLVFVGLVGMIDPPRPEVKNAIKRCRDAGIKVVMLTGDHKNTAIAIGRKIELLNDGRVLTGEDMDRLTDEELMEQSGNVEVYARVSPAHKSRIVKILRRKGEIVAVTGDGVNDAPALKDAHIGIAMGIKGTDVAKDASEIVLEDDNFATIVNAVEEGRAIYDNIRKFVRYILSANFDEIFVITAAVLLGMPLPFIPIQILWINLLTDGLPSLALGFDSKEKGIMRRKPRNPNEGILNRMMPFIIGSGILAALISFGLFYFEIKNGSSLERARTLVFTTAVIFELLFVFNCRSERDPVWRTNIFSNRFLLVAFLVGIILQAAIIYIPFLNGVFQTVPLGISDWLIIGLMSSTGLFILPKFAIRKS